MTPGKIQTSEDETTRGTNADPRSEAGVPPRDDLELTRSESRLHSHAAGHGHARSHGLPAGGTVDFRLGLSVALNLVITAAQVVGGLVSGSLALLSDALHNFSDASSLLVSLIASRLSRRKPTKKMTFGYRRAEIIGAFVNLIALGIVAVLILKEAIHRISAPEPVDTVILLSVATVGLLANILTALLLRKEVESSVNIRSAYLHIVMDALSSVAVIVGGIVIRFTDWTLIDPILSVLIAGYIVYFGWNTLRGVTDILMEAVPTDIDIPTIVKRMQSVEVVRDAHHVHVWMIDEHAVALEAHVTISADDWKEMERAKSAIKSILTGEFGIQHSTLEFEVNELPCGEAVLPDCY